MVVLGSMWFGLLDTHWGGWLVIFAIFLGFGPNWVANLLLHMCGSLLIEAMNAKSL